MMNEEDLMKEIKHEEEKTKLKKKISIFIAITAAFTILFVLAMGDEVSFFSKLSTGALFGIVFYIPGRLRDYFGMGWFMTIAISVAFLFLLLFITSKMGLLAFCIILLLPIADVGYSIYKIVSYKKKNGEA